MRLNCLSESRSFTLYKGISIASGYQNYLSGQSVVPGFLSTKYIAWIYSQPALTGEDTDPSLIVSFDIDGSEVEDRTQAFLEWCEDTGKEPDISLGFPPEWRNGAVWTVNTDSSGHSGVDCYEGADFVFCGVQKPFRVVEHFANEEAWEAASQKYRR